MGMNGNALSGMELVRRAAAICAVAHSGQTDKQGMAYASHPFCVAVRTRSRDPRVIACALLHDVVEDTPTEVDDLVMQGIPHDVADAVDAMSRRAGEPYGAYIDRVAGNPLAATVKLADLEDNSDPERGEIPASLSRRYDRAGRALPAAVLARRFDGTEPHVTGDGLYDAVLACANAFDVTVALDSLDEAGRSHVAACAACDPMAPPHVLLAFCETVKVLDVEDMCTIMRASVEDPSVKRNARIMAESGTSLGELVRAIAR